MMPIKERVNASRIALELRVIKIRIPKGMTRRTSVQLRAIIVTRNDTMLISISNENVYLFLDDFLLFIVV